MQVFTRLYVLYACVGPAVVLAVALPKLAHILAAIDCIRRVVHTLGAFRAAVMPFTVVMAR